MEIAHQDQSKSVINRINENKAVFDDIYLESDPRAYFSVLGALDYMIPDVAEPVIRQILAARAAMRGDATNVLDIGCSYGINAAVHRFPVNFASLMQRYARREMMEVPPEEMMRLDRSFFASWPDIGLAKFIGVDISERAIRYANEVGLHSGGIAVNLEANKLSKQDAAVIAPANVLLSTGSVGYVTDRTYRSLLDSIPGEPWIISFVLRMFPYDGFIKAFNERGMVTEKLAGTTFVQRRFRDAEEFERTLAALAKRGIDTNGVEADGLFQAELFLSRPAADAKAMPLDEIVSVASGRFSSFGARYVRVEQQGSQRTAMEA
ncbi:MULTISPECIES: class I SAM-dependent methyltransferase [Rhodopseudomonas]|uniref:class I SAM-dependent methyltransferase n=1 Tax=Rhodopseudomonas TaxID=1073 RepID=UPI001F26596C|nr:MULTISPECIES: class I SAM-dependent methyltransferase [Rhodopseudomonas]MDF3811710.1 class I SAM-dependent methyltransferase [Rhodopseudomonas sp. BAL398]WOK20850.1 class I SAM-dependent methyltransferase [Rhodopseudomonas sp. BAL398]